MPGAWVFLLAATVAQDVAITGTAGFGGRVVRGDRAGATVEIENPGPSRDLVVELQWADSGARQGPAGLSGRRGPVHQVQVSIHAGARKTLSVTTIVPDAEEISLWATALDAGGRTIARAEIPARLLPSDARLFAWVGTERPDGLPIPGLELARVRPDRLPEDWRGYASLEALLWLDASGSDFRTPAQVDALRTWVSSGGRLIVARSHGAGLENTPLSELLPVAIKGGREVRRLTGLAWIPGAGSAPAGKASILESVLLRGTKTLDQNGLPLVVDAPQDAGRVTFVAFDPARAPFAGWEEAPLFWSWLLGVVPPREDPPPGERVPRLFGSADLSRDAAAFPEVALPRLGGLLLLIVLYLVATGPFDYLLLRLFKRLEFTWATFPAYVLGFTACTLAAGGAFMKHAGHQREVAVVDHYEGSGFCRRRALTALLSPADLDYAAAGAEPIRSNLLSRSIGEESSAEVAGARIVDGSARRWSLRRGATGLAIADRCSVEPSPLSYTIEYIEGVEPLVRVDNRTGRAFDHAVIVTPAAIRYLGAVPPGAGLLRPCVPGVDAPEFAKIAWGHPSTGSYTGTQRASLDQQVRRDLLALCLPAPPSLADGPAHGLAGSLGLSDRIKAGGTVLLAWQTAGEPAVALDPQPARRSSVVLTRFFQGAPP